MVEQYKQVAEIICKEYEELPCGIHFWKPILLFADVGPTTLL